MYVDVSDASINRSRKQEFARRCADVYRNINPHWRVLMPLERWSDRIVIVQLGDDPQLTDDLVMLERSTAAGQRTIDAVLDFSGVRFINSSNLAKLLKIRKKMITDGGRIVLCNVGSEVWGALVVTGLEKLFTSSENVSTALATLQTT